MSARVRRDMQIMLEHVRISMNACMLTRVEEMVQESVSIFPLTITVHVDMATREIHVKHR